MQRTSRLIKSSSICKQLSRLFPPLIWCNGSSYQLCSHLPQMKEGLRGGERVGQCPLGLMLCYSSTGSQTCQEKISLSWAQGQFNLPLTRAGVHQGVTAANPWADFPTGPLEFGIFWSQHPTQQLCPWGLMSRGDKVYFCNIPSPSAPCRSITMTLIFIALLQCQSCSSRGTAEKQTQICLLISSPKKQRELGNFCLCVIHSPMDHTGAMSRCKQVLSEDYFWLSATAI